MGYCIATNLVKCGASVVAVDVKEDLLRDLKNEVSSLIV